MSKTTAEKHNPITEIFTEGHQTPEELIPEQDVEQLEKDFIEKYYVRNNRNPFATLLRLYKRYYGKLLASAIFFIIKVSPQLYLPVAMANIIDVITTRPENTTEIIVTNALIALFLVAINIPCHTMFVKYRSIATRGVEAGLRGAIVRKLQRLTIKFNKEMQSGRIQSKIIRDVESIFEFSSQIFNNGMDALINLITVFAVVIAKGDWFVLLFFILGGPASTFLVRLFHKKIASNNREFRIEMEVTSSHVADMVEMIPVTRAHGLGDTEANRMTDQVSRLAVKGFKLDKINAVFGSSSWAVSNTFRLLCLIYTVVLALNGILTAGDVALYQSYFGLLVTYISMLVNMLPIISKGSESINSVGEILGANDIEDNRGKQKVDNVKGEFVFEDVHFQYEDDHPILQGLNLTVKAGETVAIVGESGAGKSTILNLVTGFYTQSSGKVLLDGKELNKIDLTSYRKHIAVVPQVSSMFTGTIRDNITYGSPKVTKKQLDEVIEAACLKDVIDNMPLGLDTQIGEHGGKLSGGQRQRISIARALIRNPKIIILDEATSALDTVSEKHIQSAINNLAKGRTTFIVAHRLSTVKDADKIAVLKKGKCVEFGTYDELMELKGEFYNFRNLQV